MEHFYTGGVSRCVLNCTFYTDGGHCHLIHHTVIGEISVQTFHPVSSSAAGTGTGIMYSTELQTVKRPGRSLSITRGVYHTLFSTCLRMMPDTGTS